MHQDLLGLLTNSALVLATEPPAAEIQQISDHQVRRGLPLAVMYGETYDRHGVTLDSLKYYFTVAALTRHLKSRGAEATGAILIADVATCRNEPSQRHNEIMAAGRTRAEFVRVVSGLYSLDLHVILMSEYLHTPSFQTRLSQIRAEGDRDPQICAWVRQTVPKDKVAIEESKGFAYAFEEIATIVDYDIKVGPPRERFYDEPARLIAHRLGLKSLASIYLRPTYPLGAGPALFASSAEIETYGVTPYKAGSKGLQDHRIVLRRTSLARVSDLIDATFVSRKRELPNPVLDLALIAEMAGEFLGSPAGTAPAPVDRFLRGEMSSKQLKEETKVLVERNILGPVNSLASEASRV